MSEKDRRRVFQISFAHATDDGRIRGKLCPSLVAAGYDVHFMAPGPDRGLCDDGVTVYPLPKIYSRVEKITFRRKLARQVAAMQPDIVHVHEPVLLGSVIAAAPNARIVWDVHEDYETILAGHIAIPPRLRRAVWRLWDFRERQLLKKVDLVLAATPGVEARYLPLHDNVVCVPNYPELEVFDGSHNWTHPHAVFAGSIEPNRGVIETIKALGITRRKGLRIKYTIAGPVCTTALEHEIRETITTEGLDDDVRYLGPIPRADVIALLQTATIGVVAHLPESQGDIAWPVKMFEYMACGLPLLYSTLGAMVEIADGEQIGVPVPAGDVAAIAAAFEKLATDAEFCEASSRKGREMIRSRYSWSHVEKRLVIKFEELTRRQ